MEEIIIFKNHKKEIAKVFKKEIFLILISEKSLAIENYSEILVRAFSKSDQYICNRPIGHPFVLIEKGELYTLAEWIKIARERYRRSDKTDLQLISSILCDDRFDKVT